VTPGQEKQFVFNVTAGERVFFDASGGALNFGWNLVSPSGVTVFARNYQDTGTTELTESGSYVLTVGQASNSRTGTFSFQLLDVPAITSTPIQLDQLVEDQLATLGQLKRYTFSGSAGQKVFPNIQSGDLGLGFRLFSPSGASIRSVSFLDSGAIELPEDGQYTIELGSETSGRTQILIPYSFTIVDVPPVAPVDIELDESVVGAIDIPTQTQSYTFDGLAGQQIYFDLVDPAFAFNHGVSIVGPAGEVVLDAQLVSPNQLMELPASGEYTVSIFTDTDRLLDFEFIVFDSTPLGYKQSVTSHHLPV